MKKTLATAGKTVVKFIAARASIFFAVALVPAIVAAVVQSDLVMLLMPYTAALLLCMCLESDWKVAELRSELDNTCQERDALERQLEMEKLKSHIPESGDELAQLKDGGGVDLRCMQLARIQHRAELADAQQQLAKAE